ncbi:NADH-quinone oxidoreductase subunit J, partial [Helicobacter pylori]
MFETIAFYFFAILTLSMALVVITTTNILYAITALASSMVFISAFFFLL